MKTPSIFRFVAGEVTRLEVFDFVMNKMEKQGKASISADGNCMYRGPDGCRCGIGHIITNDELKLLNKLVDGSIDDVNIRDFYRVMDKNNYVVSSDTKFEDGWFLEAIQSAHDYAAGYSPDRFIRNFNYRMKQVEKDYL